MRDCSELDFWEATICEASNALERIYERISGFVQDLVDTVVNYMTDLIGGVLETIESAFVSIRDSITNVFDNVVSTISNFIDSATTAIGNMIDGIVDYISGLIDSAANLLSDVYDYVVGKVSELFSETVSLLNDIVDSIRITIGEITDEVKSYFQGLFDTVQGAITQVIGQASEVVASITGAVKQFVDEVVNVVGNTLRDLLETIASLPDSISSLAESLIESARENIADPIKALPAGFITDIIERISGEPVEEAERVNQAAMTLIFGSSPVAQTPEKLRELIQAAIPENIVGKALIAPFVAVFVIMNVLQGIAHANSAIVLQEHALVNPYRLMEPPDIVRAVHYGLIDKGQAQEWLRKTGYTESVADMLLQVGKIVPPAGETVAWWLRGIMDDAQFNESLTKGGWQQEDIERFKQAAYFIPPVNDLITMSVREVFSPDVAARFGQFDDFPEDLLEWSAKQGVSEEWAKRYWAAHWALPSVQMGFEMLHRDVIAKDDLELLLRASDVMPFWRDKLIDISYSPLTRVDVRRMHKLGVIDEAGVTRAYKDLGYNEDNARLLTEFVVQYNAETSTDDDNALSDLTRTNIINFYTDGVIGREDAATLLTLVGISEEAAALFLTSADIQIERDARKQAIDTIIAQASTGTITFEEAQDALASIGLETVEREKAIAELLRLQAKANKLPSKADLDKFLSGGIINEAEYIETLQRIGYNATWSNRYLQLLKGG
jgi:hypothetical protein